MWRWASRLRDSRPGIENLDTEKISESFKSVGNSIGATKDNVKRLIALNWTDCEYTCSTLITAQLFSLNCDHIETTLEIFQKELSKEEWLPAGRAQLLSFAWRYKLLDISMNFTGCIVGMGSATLKDSPKYRRYPYIQYEEGIAVDLGTLEGSDVVENGPFRKYFFLAWKY